MASPPAGGSRPGRRARSTTKRAPPSRCRTDASWRYANAFFTITRHRGGEGSSHSMLSVLGWFRGSGVPMKTRLVVSTFGVVALCAVVFVRLEAQNSSQATRSRPLVSEAQYEAWQRQLSNWGRWGTDDQLGTLNLITPAKRRAALALVKEGVPISLSTNTFFAKTADTPCPAEWAMTTATDTGATDRVAYPCIHGAAATHIDSLAHTFFRGKMWNGYDATTLVTKEKGAEKNSVLPMKNGIVTRAVLYDIARLKGVPYLAPGDRIFPEDLEAWEKKTGVKAGPGDALVLRWGRYGRRAKLGPEAGAAGFDNSILPWLNQRDVALIVW